MYWAKQRAVAPLVTALFATVQVGKLMFFNPAFCTSALIPAGVISGVPTTCSCFSSVLTVLRPLTPITIATMPNTIRTAPATSPPISNALRISNSLCQWSPGRRRLSSADFDLNLSITTQSVVVVLQAPVRDQQPRLVERVEGFHLEELTSGSPARRRRTRSQG